MNRKDRRAALAQQHQFARDLPERLTLVPEDEYPSVTPRPIRAWVSRDYQVQLYDEDMTGFPHLLRMSVVRAKLGKNGHWKDGITWDELQAIKSEIGYGDKYAIEIYPADRDLVRVANVRHIWILHTPLPIGWFKDKP
jgi:hypothetical protein